MAETSDSTAPSLSSSGYEDGLGRRTLAFDRETGGIQERLHLRPEFWAFERAIAARVRAAAERADAALARARAAIERAEVGMRLSPVDTQSHFYLLFLALAHYVNGTYDESIIWGRKGAALNPSRCSNLRWLIASLVATNQIDEARHFAQALLEVNPGFTLSAYGRWCPLKADLRTELIERLRIAGLPE